MTRPATVLALLLAACLPMAAAAKEEAPDIPPIETLGRGNDCTWARSIDDWKPVDRDHILIHGPGRRDRFLVRVTGTCMANPRFETAIGIQSSDEQLCPYGGDALIMDGERCTILNMWRLPQEKTPADKTEAPARNAPGR